MKQQEENDFKELFGALETEQPSMRFTKNVMDGIEELHIAPAAKRYSNPWIVKGIAALLILSVIALSTYVFITAGTQTDYAAGLNSSNHIEFLHKLNANYAIYIILANVFLLFVLIERLASRKRRMHYLERLN